MIYLFSSRDEELEELELLEVMPKELEELLELEVIPNDELEVNPKEELEELEVCPKELEEVTPKEELEELEETLEVNPSELLVPARDRELAELLDEDELAGQSHCMLLTLFMFDRRIP